MSPSADSISELSGEALARGEPVMVPHWVRGIERATLVSHRNQNIVLTALGGSAFVYSADLANMESIERLTERIS